jgi:hypothetical protein
VISDQVECGSMVKAGSDASRSPLAFITILPFQLYQVCLLTFIIQWYDNWYVLSGEANDGARQDLANHSV